MRYFVSIVFLILPLFCFSQIVRCGTDQYREHLKEKGLYNYSKEDNQVYNIYDGNYNIPVVVHVLYNTEEQNISDDRIYSQIQTLNEDYNALNTEIENVPEEFANIIGNAGLSFCLVQSDLEGNSFNGINRVYTDIESFNMSDDAMKKTNEGGVDAWDTSNYLNFWICNLSGNLLGFATMPGDVSPELDGVVIGHEYFGVDLSFSSPYNLGRTGTHEVGHYFNLEHTFYAGCSDWDNCDDTPPISSPTYGCPDFPQESCDAVSMTMNYMDYTDDACMSMFTSCQVDLMIDALLSLRSSLVANNDCSVSINNIQYSDISIYPNPVIDCLNIDITNTFVFLFDTYGRQVLSKYITDDSFLDMSLLSSGLYMLYIANTNDIYQIIKRN